MINAPPHGLDLQLNQLMVMQFSCEFEAQGLTGATQYWHTLTRHELRQNLDEVRWIGGMAREEDGHRGGDDVSEEDEDEEDEED